jgi:HNH endonuclease
VDWATAKGHKSPLAQTDYKGLADTYQREHPKDNLPKAEPGTHPARRRTAFIHLLEQQRDELDRQADSPVNKAMASVTEQVWQDEAAQPPPLDDEDARRRVYAQIISREGQPSFRLALIKAYSCRCVVTGCDAEPALEAAHLRPYRGPAGNAVNNGLLLRADIHTLFDRNLLAIHPQTREVALSPQLSGTQYQMFSGVPIGEPLAESQRPSQDVLNERWEQFQKE